MHLSSLGHSRNLMNYCQAGVLQICAAHAVHVWLISLAARQHTGISLTHCKTQQLHVRHACPYATLPCLDTEETPANQTLSAVQAFRSPLSTACQKHRYRPAFLYTGRQHTVGLGLCQSLEAAPTQATTTVMSSSLPPAMPHMPACRAPTENGLSSLDIALPMHTSQTLC